MRTLAQLFGQSPFRPLQAHMEKVTECVEEVPALFERLLANDTEGIITQREKIASLESEADEMKNELRGHLPSRLFLPVNRRDLLDMLDMQDTIANLAEDIGDLLIERHFEVPEPMRGPLVEYVASSVKTVQLCRSAIKRLDELVEVGFAGPEAQTTLTEIDAVLRVEDENDEQLVALRKTLFAHEDRISPVSVILWLQIFDLIGDLADYAKKVANRLRLLIAR